MSVLLSEPYLLSSYPVPSRVVSGTSSGQSSRGYITATTSKDSHGKGYATVSVQGDGFHVLELSNMHPVASHTLGPLASFVAPAVTRFDTPEASTSYAALQNELAGVKGSDALKTVHRWWDHLSNPAQLSDTNPVLVFLNPVQKVWAHSLLPSHTIGISPHGDIMVMSDKTREIASTGTKMSADAVLKKSFVFDAADCTFFKAGDSASLLIVCFVVLSDQLKIRVNTLNAAGELGGAVEYTFSTLKVDDITNITCDTAGYITFLVYPDAFHIFQLSRETSGQLSMTALHKPLRLGGITWNPSMKVDDGTSAGLSAVSAGPAFVMLAAFRSSSHSDVIFLLWDVQFAIILASHLFILPSSLTSSPKSLPFLDLVPASDSQILLVVSPRIKGSGQKAERSAVFIMPTSLPAASTVALAMGKAHDTKKWLYIPGNANLSWDDNVRRELVQSVTKALDGGRAEDAEKAFFAWIDTETNRLETQRRERMQQKKEHVKPSQAAVQPYLSHQFVSTFLKALLLVSRKSYSGKIVHYFIKHDAVGNGMVDGGLLPALRHWDDWPSISAAFQHVNDLPETDIIDMLAHIIKCHRQPLAENTMHIGIPAVPSLQRGLAMVVDYQTSSPLLRLALKRQFSDAQDILPMVEVLAAWLNLWSRTSVKVGDGASEEKLSHSSGIPSLQRILTFLQNILDAHFFLLLQYQPSHRLLRQISTAIDTQLSSIGDLNRLQGPLEAFARAKTQAQKAAPKRMEDGEQRRKRREAYETAEIAIGEYQVEDITL